MLPSFVYDLIGAVQKFEDEHGDTTMCFDGVLAAVPTDERHAAAVLAAYKLEQSSTPTVPAEPQPYPVGSIEPLADLATAARDRLALIDATPDSFLLRHADLERMGLPNLEYLCGRQVVRDDDVPAGHMRIEADGCEPLDVPIPGLPEEPVRRAPRSRCTLTPNIAPETVRDAIADAFERAVTFNHEYALGDPEYFGLNAADALDFGLAHAQTVHTGGLSVVVLVKEDVPRGWLRVHADGRHHDNALPAARKKA